MGFIKTANAKIIKGHENLSWKDWAEISGKHFNTRTAAKVIKNYNPNDYLLTHCTIIASVNVDPEVPHYITPDTSKYVNNNGDSWESSLLATPEVYRSFIGSYNFLEHVQVESLSKGRVISAALREVPAGPRSKENIFLVDILVATDRKHTGLINKISSGELSTLSMGCHVSYTICSKCGSKAFDEDELCNHIKYAKNTYFYDETGKKRIVAELCGHKEDPESVRFIEASWVAVPAFPGAVMRNILSFKEDKAGDEAREKFANMIAQAYESEPEKNLSSQRQKAASKQMKLASVISELYQLSKFLRTGN